MGNKSWTTVKSQLQGGFKGMPPEIALNRWLTCGCIVSATRKITVRCRWRCPRCGALLMVVTPCALVLSIPAPRGWGPRCALRRRRQCWCCWCCWWWCPPPPPPPPPSPRPSVRPALLLKLPQSRFIASSSERNHNYPPCLPPLGFIPPAALTTQHTNTHLIGVQGGFSTGSDTCTQTHKHTAHKHTPLRAVFLPPPALRGFKGPICRLTWLELSSQLADTLPALLQAWSTRKKTEKKKNPTPIIFSVMRSCVSPLCAPLIQSCCLAVY